MSHNWHQSLVDVSLGILFDSVLPTQEDVLAPEPPVDLVFPEDTVPSNPLKTAKEITTAVNKFSRISFAIIDTLKATTVTKVGKKQGPGILCFPTRGAGSNVSPDKPQVPISRICLMVTWSEDFFKYCQKASQIKDDEKTPKPPTMTTQVARFVVWDGHDMWNARVTFGDLKSLEFEECSKLFQILGIGTTKARKKIDPKGTGVIFTVNEDEARLQLLCGEEDELTESFFRDPGLQCMLAKSGVKQEELISNTFIAAYKQHVLAQHLTASLLLNLVGLQRASVEVVKDGKQLAANRSETDRQTKAKMLELLNTKKRRIAELQDEVKELRGQMGSSPGRLRSPQKKAKPPIRIARPKRASPKRSPKRRSPSPKRLSASPKRRSVSPKRRSVSPKRRSVSPKVKAKRSRKGSPKKGPWSPTVEVSTDGSPEFKGSPGFEIIDEVAVYAPKHHHHHEHFHTHHVEGSRVSPPRRARAQRLNSPRRNSRGEVDFSGGIPHRCQEEPFRKGDRNIASEVGTTRPQRHSPTRHSPPRGSPARGSPARASPPRGSPARRSPTRGSPARRSPGRGSPNRRSPARNSAAPYASLMEGKKGSVLEIVEDVMTVNEGDIIEETVEIPMSQGDLFEWGD